MMMAAVASDGRGRPLTGKPFAAAKFSYGDLLFNFDVENRRSASVE
jgi:hypothetical protein